MPLLDPEDAYVVGLLQVYSRLAELEVAAGEAPKFPGKGYATLPENTAEKARDWAEKEGEKAQFTETLDAFNKDPMGTLRSIG